MNILEEIVAYKRKQVADISALTPIKKLEQSTYFQSQPVSFRKYIMRSDKIGLIAEIKRKSPSKGSINPHVSIEKTSIGYMQAGASGLSILTDEKYFGGKNEFLIEARNYNFCPILRKDFIIDEYQVIEAKSIGADAILLIAACLKQDEIKHLASLAASLGMEVLLEVHSRDELDRSLVDEIDMVGVNNRDLTDFKTSVDTSRSMIDHIPKQFVKISESGISDPETVVELMNIGYNGFLIGEYFMQFGRPEKACLEFVKKVKALK
jgi:indole-3-glycerol phosphate synthase